MELDDQVHAEITRLCQEGDRLAAEGEYGAAVEKYTVAMELLPEPKLDYEAAHWILTALGDTLFSWGKPKSALRALTDAMRTPGALGNPFNHLRLGQVYFELGELDRAADELMRAYMGHGEAIFEGEHPRYLEFLRTRARI